MWNIASNDENLFYVGFLMLQTQMDYFLEEPRAAPTCDAGYSVGKEAPQFSCGPQLVLLWLQLSLWASYTPDKVLFFLRAIDMCVDMPVCAPACVHVSIYV